MIPSSDTSAAAMFAQNQQAAAGIDTRKAMSFDVSGGDYSLPDPQTGIIATLFPGDSTWHSLYDNDYKEVAGHLFSIEGMKTSSEQKHIMVSKVKDIVIESYHHGAMARVYWSIIILAFMLFAKFYYKVESDLLDTAIIGVAVLAAGLWVYASTAAKGAGTSHWNTFMADLTSKLNTGKLPSMILQEYGADAERERDRAAIARARPASTGSNSFLGAALGALAGTMISR